MKNISIDRLCDFEFHDAVFVLDCFHENLLCVSASALNIHKDAEPNPYPTDMEIKHAKISLKGFQLISYKQGGAFIYDENGNVHLEKPQPVLTGKNAENYFFHHLKEGITVNSLGVEDEKTYFLEALANDPNFIACFSFESVTIEWDSYKGKSWYVSFNARLSETEPNYKKTLKSNIVLLSPEGKTSVPIQIRYSDDDDDYVTPVEVSLTYENTQYKCCGEKYLWEDAFAELQRKLPNGVQLACCLTCRHGNFCPYGNSPNQLFCTKDYLINDKMDMCDLYSNTNISENIVPFCNYCESFVYQSDDFYTYSDFLYHLKKDL